MSELVTYEQNLQYVNGALQACYYWNAIKDKMVDTRVKGSSPLQPNGWRYPSPYKRHVESGQCYSYGMRLRAVLQPPYPPSTVDAFGACDLGYPQLSVPQPSAALISAAEGRALAKLQGDVNLSVAFGERRETIDMVSQSAKRIYRTLRQLRKGDITGAARNLGLTRSGRFKGTKSVAELWLELQYGWKPLLSDTFGALEHLNTRDRLDEDRYHLYVKGFARESDVTHYDFSAKNCWWRYNIRQKHEFTTGCFVRLDYVLENRTLVELNQLGVLNPLLLTWELLPFSFVADWFLPIGSYLSNFNADLGWHFRSGSKTTFGKDYITALEAAPPVFRDNYYGPVKFLEKDLSAEGKRFWMDRTVYGAAPRASLPSFDWEPFRGNRAANAIALLRSFFKS